METLTLRNRFQRNCTIVENEFIDHYMIEAHGEYVKVYLMLLRHLTAQNSSLTISKLADYLECTAKDIVRALNYWAKEGLLEINYNESGSICGLSIGHDSQHTNAVPENVIQENIILENAVSKNHLLQKSSISPDASKTMNVQNVSTPSDVPIATTPTVNTTIKSDDSKNTASSSLPEKTVNTESSETSESLNQTEDGKKLPPRSPSVQEELDQLYFVAEQYIGRPLSFTEINKITYFYDGLHFSSDLIGYLIEYCVENGHRSIRYIETVAIAWSDAGIKTIAEAKNDSAMYHKNGFAVLKAFGIKGRNPAPVEIGYIKKWSDEYGFSLDIILEACNRTITNTSKPDFKYTDSILKNWLAKEVHHLSDLEKLDLAYQQEKTAKTSKTNTTKTRSTQQATKSAQKPAFQNRFNNFEGRSYDMASLEQQLLEKQLLNTQ